MSRSKDFQVEAGPPSRERREVCSVMILYEDLHARALAIQLHDRLIPRFIGEIEFGFNWWRFDYLADPEIAREAAACALRADLILVSLHQLPDVSLTVKSWFETWLWKRPTGKGRWPWSGSHPPPESQSRMTMPIFVWRPAGRVSITCLWPFRPRRPRTLIDSGESWLSPPRPPWGSLPNPQFQSSDWGLNE